MQKNKENKKKTSTYQTQYKYSKNIKGWGIYKQAMSISLSLNSYKK